VRIAKPHIESKETSLRERMRQRPLRLNQLRLGLPWGLGRDALGYSHLTFGNAERDYLHLLGCPPSLYEINVRPHSRGVNKSFCRKGTKV
jgi:hypothetical protein